MATQAYIGIAIISLALIVFLTFWKNKKIPGKRISPLGSLGFGFVLAGVLFGENRFLGYGLIGIGIALSLVDIFRSK